MERGESLMAGGKHEKVDGVGEETEVITVEEKESKMDERQAEAEEEKEVAVEGAEEDYGIGASSCSLATSGEDIVGAEGPVVKKEMNLENEVGRQKEALPVTVSEDGLIAEAEHVIALQKDVGDLDGDRQDQKDKKQNDVVETANIDKKMCGEREMEEEDYSQLNADGLLPVTLQDTEMVEGGKAKASGAEDKVVKDSELELKGDADGMEVEEQNEIKMEERRTEAEEHVNEATPIGEKATEENQVNVGIKLGEEEEASKGKESCSFGKEEKLDGNKQDDESNAGGETVKGDEKMCGDRQPEEAGGSQLNADGLSPVILQDDEILEDGKTKALGIEITARKESGIELKESLEGMVEVKMEVEEERQKEEKEDEEMDCGVEKETKDEEREVAVEEEKQLEEDEREAPHCGSGKRKRGRNHKSAGKALPRKIVEEDVCFICLDGGDLVLCDRRGCPKAYHPSCVDRDEAFFRSKGRWDCGWHLCRQCKKNAHYMCYTCQCSLCKGCLTDDASFFCVRGSKGLCQTCMKSVMLIENNEGNAQMATFDDTSSMDYLFKDYWTEQKENLSLTSDEIAMLIFRWKRSNGDHNQEMLTEAHARNTEGGVISDSSLGPTNSVRKKSKKQMPSSTVELDYDADSSAGKTEATGAKKRGRRSLKSQSEGADSNLDNSFKDNLGNAPKRKKANRLSDAHAFEFNSPHSSSKWASKELLEFVAHVKNGDKSALSQFDVQELLLEYVKRNNLRDPRRSGQIVCDAMLQKLFGKPRVGHIEMLKLLESHFLSVEDSQGDDNQGSVLDADVSLHGTDENTDSFMDVGKSRVKKARKRGDSRGLQSNLDDYAAIDVHNIKLIYLRRNLIEALMEDRDSFHVKVVGSFVRIRIIGSSQKQEIHRLVQVIGTPKVSEPYKLGKRTADCMLEILNLNKKEVISINTISNQEFDEDECKRLRQSIKCGFLSRLTVGDVLDKAKDLHVVRVTDWLETEITRHNHLRDRASDLGRKKQLRECVEKLQLLNTPEERQRKLDEIPEVHADPNMDPSHESEDESESDKGGDIWRRDTWREREHLPFRRGSDSPSTDPWSSAAKSPTKKWEPTRSLSGKGFSSRSGDAVVAEEALSGKPWSPAGNKVSPQSTSLEKLRIPSDSLTSNQALLSETRTNLPVSETSRPSSASLVQNEVTINETEKSWHYKDPTGKVQGPFSVAQLRKWNKSGYFPATLKIWRTTQSENDSMLLSEALSGKSEKEPTKPVETPSQQVPRGQVISTLKIDPNRVTDQLSPTVQRSQTDPRFSSNDSKNRPTSQSVSSSATGRTRVSRWSGSPIPVDQLPSTATPIPDGSQVSRFSASTSYEQTRASDRSDSTRQSTRDDERQHLSSQSTHHTLQSVTGNTATVSTISVVVQPSNGQNPALSAYGWGSTNQMLNPNLINMNPLQTQGQLQQQQSLYGHWQNTAVNNLPPTPPYSAAGQTTSSATFPAQNLSGLASQSQWTSQVPPVQPNQAAVAATQLPGNAGWAQMQQQAYINMGWVAPTGPFPYAQYASQPGAVAGPAMVQASSPALGTQPGSMNPAGWVTSATNPGVVGSWNWQPPQSQTQAQAQAQSQSQSQSQSQGIVAPGTLPKGQKACPYLVQGHCRKGAACDFRHN